MFRSADHGYGITAPPLWPAPYGGFDPVSTGNPIKSERMAPFTDQSYEPHCRRVGGPAIKFARSVNLNYYTVEASRCCRQWFAFTCCVLCVDGKRDFILFGWFTSSAMRICGTAVIVIARTTRRGINSRRFDTRIQLTLADFRKSFVCRQENPLQLFHEFEAWILNPRKTESKSFQSQMMESQYLFFKLNNFYKTSGIMKREKKMHEITIEQCCFTGKCQRPRSKRFIISTPNWINSQVSVVQTCEIKAREMESMENTERNGERACWKNINI